MRNLAVAALWMPTLAWAAPELSAEVASDGPLRARLSHAAADAVVLVVGEHDGDLDPCGCHVRPLGGLARAVGYRDAVARDAPTVLVHDGGWVDGTVAGDGALRGDARMGNAAMADALARFDVVNVGAQDGRWGAGLGVEGLVSTNVHAGAPSVLVRQVGAVRVAFVGVAGGRGVSDPVSAVHDAVAGDPGDVVVVLGHHLGADIARVAAVPGVDVLVTADDRSERWGPERLGSVIWLRTMDDGQAVTELRLRVTDGVLTGVLARSVDLDRRIPEDREVARLASSSQQARQDWQLAHLR